MKRIPSSTPHGKFLGVLSSGIDAAVLELFGQRIGRFKKVTRPNDYFFHAAELGSCALVALLAKAGFSPNTCDRLDHGLHVAVQKGDVALTRCLLDHGSRVDLRDETLATGLIIAAAAGDLPMVEMLLEQGAKPHLKDDAGQTAIVAAASNRHATVVKQLSPVSSTVERKYAERIMSRPEQLAPRAAEFHKLQEQAILLATRPEKMGKLRTLLEEGIAPDIPGHNGATALMGCNTKLRTDLADLLLSYGASADAADDAGQTALDWSVWGDNPALYRKLYAIATPQTRQQAKRLLRRLKNTHTCQDPTWHNIS